MSPGDEQLHASHCTEPCLAPPFSAHPEAMTDRKDRVYIATSYANAKAVHETIRPALEAMGFRVVSTWHDPPHAPEDLQTMGTLRLLAAHWMNRAQIQKADAVIVLDSPLARETYAEAEYAISHDVKIVYIGERPPPLAIEVVARAGEAAVFRSFDEFTGELKRWELANDGDDAVPPTMRS